jgi:multisubunit Na+/H+ antiporter MnhF subunit
MQNQQNDEFERTLDVHIMSVSATLVGVCLMVIGIFRVTNKMTLVNSLGDDLLALDTVGFLASCMLSYFALRAREKRRQKLLEKLADRIFLISLSFMVLISIMVVYELL